MKIPNKLSRFCITKKAGFWGGFNRARTLSDLKQNILQRNKGNGNKSIGVYVKIAELPDDISNSEVDKLIEDIGKDYKDE